MADIYRVTYFPELYPCEYCRENLRSYCIKQKQEEATEVGRESKNLGGNSETEEEELRVTIRCMTEIFYLFTLLFICYDLERNWCVKHK